MNSAISCGTATSSIPIAAALTVMFRSRSSSARLRVSTSVAAAWIESEFPALRYFTLDGSDYPSHTAQEAAIEGYIRWVNKQARSKRRFAPESKIRRPDYLPNVA
jgi:hypothetical protein